MTDLPRIAVVTPSYNTGRHLAAAIESVLGQDYSNVDYLVMDGSSTDESIEVLRGFNGKVRWVSQKDDGQSDALRRGFEQTTGDILTWLNSDDTFAPGAFKIVAEFFAAHPDVALVYGDAKFIDADGALIGPCVHVEPFNAKRLVHYSDFIVQPAAFFRRSAYEAVGGIDTTLHFGMDYDLWLKLAKQFKVEYLPQHLGNYRWLTDNKTATGSFRRLDEITSLVERQGYAEPAYIRLERVNLHLRQAIGAMKRGGLIDSVRSIGRAVSAAMSPRALWSMFQWRTWRIIWMGQVLRSRAAGLKNGRGGDAERGRAGEMERARENVTLGRV
jgi:glycosyltransferase involved in cell wall biosynthesis